MSVSCRRVVDACRHLSLILLILFAGTLFSFPQAPPVYFEKFLAERFASKTSQAGWNSEKFCPVSTSVVAKRILESYGSMFSAAETVVLPTTCIHPGEAEVIKYQKGLATKPVYMGATTIELQTKAAEALESAVGEAILGGSVISPLDGAIAGRRSYGDTLRIWNSRYFPALDFWINQGRLTEIDRDAINRLSLEKKVEKVLEWEAQQIYFSTNRRRSILTSTAPPGTSQHLALIALDIVEYWNPNVRAALNRNGWYQTIVDDPPHFTYLGVAESGLPGRGLRAVAKGGFLFWIPNLSPTFPTEKPAS